MSHLTISERLKIECFLKEGRSFQEIACLLGKARSTIVREVQKHKVESLKPGYHRIPNRCINRRQCQLKHVCPKIHCYRQCAAPVQFATTFALNFVKRYVQSYNIHLMFATDVKRKTVAH